MLVLPPSALCFRDQPRGLSCPSSSPRSSLAFLWLPWLCPSPLCPQRGPEGIPGPQPGSTGARRPVQPKDERLWPAEERGCCWPEGGCGRGLMPHPELLSSPHGLAGPGSANPLPYLALCADWLCPLPGVSPRFCHGSCARPRGLEGTKMALPLRLPGSSHPVGLSGDLASSPKVTLKLDDVF